MRHALDFHDDDLDLDDDCLTSEPLTPDKLYWCQHCHRTFLGRDARRDFFGGMQGCRDESCGASGLGIDIFAADDPYVTGEGGYDCLDADTWHYRDEILRIDTMDDVDEVARFSGRCLCDLARLFEFRAAKPDERHNGAPSSLECVTFLCVWPELRVHGHATHPGREGDGGAVRIEGFECDLTLLDPDLIDPLRAAFMDFVKTADVIQNEALRLYARWS